MASEISVASSVYNMAGDEKDRAQFLKSLVIRNVLSNTKRGLGETMTNGYLGGPGIKFRSFFRWADINYDYIGMPSGTLRSAKSFNPANIGPFITTPVGSYPWVQDAWVGDSDFMMWAEQWMANNRPNDFNKNWSANIDIYTNLITIRLGGVVIANFYPVNYVSGATYIFAYYNIITGLEYGPVVVGTPVPMEDADVFPSTTGWTSDTDVSAPHEVELETVTTVLKTYSDETPDDEEVTTEIGVASYNSRVRTFHKDTLLTGGGANLQTRRDIMSFFENKTVIIDTEETVDVEVIGGVTVTTTTTVETEMLQNVRSHRTDYQIISRQSWSTTKVFIYRVGSGNAELDDLVNPDEAYGKFFPMIPLRLNGNMISPSYLPAAYNIAKKAYKKATDGGSYDDLLDQIGNHEDVEDMDYAYTVFGVSLNVVEKSCRKYIYEFFKRLMGDQTGGPSVYQDYINYTNNYAAAYATWSAWQAGGGVGPEPILPVMPTIAKNEIVINSDGSISTNFDMRLSWIYMAETFANGLGRTGARVGDLWITFMGQDSFAQQIFNPNNEGGFFDSTVNYDKIRIYWQYAPNQYKYIDAVGLVHRNYIYSGRYVEITAKQALDDPKESGFIVPLHYGTYSAMSLVDSTQMSTACMFIVINSYTERVKQWWESWWFQIIVVIVIAVVSVTLTGGAGLGLLGSHFAVGGALGLTGMTAAIVGSIANALAAMVLVTLIGSVATSIFGEQWGAVIGVIVSFIAMQSIMNFHATGSFGLNVADLMRAENLIKLTNAAVSGYQAIVAGEITSMQNDLERLQEEANAEMKRIQAQYLAEFGYGGGQIDPLMYVGNSPVMAESRDTFLSRTLMTGSDIAEMSHSMLNDYTELMLTLPNAFT